MGPKKMRIQSRFCNPLRNEPSVLPGRHASFGTSSPSKHEIAWLLRAGDYEVVDGSPGLLRQFEPDWFLSLLLSYGCSFGGISIWGDVLAAAA
jgi:hypothetical protein